MIYPGGRHGWKPAKGKHDFSERARFYYNNLLDKPAPAEVLK
ncbi:hypothetical protein [Pedobacter sp. NJ-S-72]